MPGRRSFLIGCGGMVAAPAFAQLALPLAQPAAADSPASTACREDPVLRIDGWDTPDARGGVWIHINSSWRAAWR